MKKLNLTILIVLLIACGSFAQSITSHVVNISGGTRAYGYYTLDWSVGEMSLIDEMTGADSAHIITNGFMQPFIYDRSTVDPDTKFGAGEIRILPNPTRDVVEVDYLSGLRGPVQIKLYDEIGRTVHTATFISYGYGNIFKIDMRCLMPGAYTLFIISVSSDPGVSKRSGSYKILKIN